MLRSCFGGNGEALVGYCCAIRVRRGKIAHRDRASGMVTVDVCCWVDSTRPGAGVIGKSQAPQSCVLTALNEKRPFASSVLFDSEPPIDSTASYTSLKPIQTTKNEVVRMATNRDEQVKEDERRKKGYLLSDQTIAYEKKKKKIKGKRRMWRDR